MLTLIEPPDWFGDIALFDRQSCTYAAAQRKRGLHVSQVQLSRLLAISRQTTNQVLKNLEQQGLIRL